MKSRIFFLFFFFLGSGVTLSRLHAQDLTGIWRGHFRSNLSYERLLTNYDDRYKMEVQIAQSSGLFEAVTYSYKNTEFYGKATASGTVNFQSRKVVLKEGKLLEVRFASGYVCLMTCFLQYSKLGNDEYLQGTYYSVRVGDSSADCGKGSIFLHRVVESDFYKEPFLEKKEKELLAKKKSPEKPDSSQLAVTPGPDSVVIKKNAPPSLAKKKATVKKPAPASAAVVKSNPPVKKPVTAAVPPPTKTVQKNNVPPPPTAKAKSNSMVPEQSRHRSDSSIKITAPATVSVPQPEVLRTRTNELLKTITVSHPNIELRLYDDGAIDNDTVSVYYDNKLIASKVRLTDQAVVIHIQVEPSDHPHQLVMVAENLGDIPPNTSLLVVRDGEKRYEDRIISTEQKNVAIRFQYRKPE
jgi:hypothetical protein